MLKALIAALCFLCLAPDVHELPVAEEPRVEWGTERFVEWIHGDAPIVISAPHGGGEKPGSIPNRTKGKTVRDGHTEELARLLVEAIHERTGRRPHLILCHLHRSKLDANREIVEAAQGSPEAERAWREYHASIERARAVVTERFGRGLYVDLHGQSHPQDWIEWGYALSGRDLAKSDRELEKIAARSSIRELASRRDRTLAELLRGPRSLGGLAEALGHVSVPGPTHPHPDGADYFSGGYSTKRHGSRAGGKIDGVQLELPRSLRRERHARERVARDLAQVFTEFLRAHYDIDWVESE